MSTFATSISFAFAVIPYPPTVLRVTVPATPPPVRPSPAVTPVTVPPIAVTSLKVIPPAPSVANTWFAVPSDVGNVYALETFNSPEEAILALPVTNKSPLISNPGTVAPLKSTLPVKVLTPAKL